MEKDFQTSFIPRKPMVDQPSPIQARSVSLLAIFSIFVFFTMLLATGGLFFYKNILKKNTQKMESDLTLAQNRFEPETISRLERLDKRLRSASKILGGHTAVTPIFKSLEDVTLPSVRYTKFAYSLNGGESPASLPSAGK